MREPASDEPISPQASTPQSAVAQTAESQSTTDTAASSQSGTSRLVIRVKIIPEGPPQTSRRWRLSRGALLLILGAVAVLLSWVGISLFRADRSSAPVVTERAPNSASQSPVPILPKPASETDETRSAPVEPRAADAKPVEPEVPAKPDAWPSPIKAVVPDVPRSARETIRGTIRVSVRVTVDKQGAVLAATADDPGPSRYFERIALEAAKKWTFAPTDSQAQRVMLVRFNFTRGGATARVNSLNR